MAVYTLDELFAINCADFGVADPTLAEFFKKITGKTSLKNVKHDFPNKYNIYFNRIPKRLICNDPEVIKRIRAILSKISPQNYESLRDKLKDFIVNSPVPHEQIAYLIHTNLIDSVFLIDVYIKLLIDIEPEFPKLMFYIHHLILDQAKNPRKFEKDDFRETGKDKTKRWSVSNGVIMTHIYLKGKYSKKFYNNTLRQWLDGVSSENPYNLEIFVKILSLKTPTGNNTLIRKKHLDNDIIEKLTSITEDKSYPGRLRFLLEVKN